jgi:hypothetical protein
MKKEVIAFRPLPPVRVNFPGRRSRSGCNIRRHVYGKKIHFMFHFWKKMLHTRSLKLARLHVAATDAAIRQVLH